MQAVYIVSAKRTALGSFLGTLAATKATSLAATVIKNILEEHTLAGDKVDEVFMGNVLSANLGQAPARQAAIEAGLSENIPCTTINKVCASGMKSVMLGAQSILSGDNNLVIAGGMENMSQTPFYMDGIRSGHKLGHQSLIDGMLKDGLTDAYSQTHMGNAAELCAQNHAITREEQDNYAINSYKRSAAAWQEGLFKSEIVPVSIPQRKGEPIIFDEDEEYQNVKFEKIPHLRPVFQKDGSVTAANASTLNDGAAVLLLASEAALKEYKLKPIAKIIAYSDAAQKPELFTTAPAKALPIALKKAHLSIEKIDYFEINEAFSVVSLANNKLLGLNPDKVNVFGGAVSLGHPLGCSGARILVTLANVLDKKNATYGAAAICNGGGGASAVIIEHL